MVKRNLALAMVALMLVAGMSLYAEEGEGNGDGEANVVAIDKLPKEVKEAATKAVEGIMLMKAKTEKTEDGTVFVILGHVKEVKWMVKVRVDAEGKVVETKASKMEAEKAPGAKPEQKNEAGHEGHNH